MHPYLREQLVRQREQELRRSAERYSSRVRAQDRWRAVNASHLVAVVRVGVTLTGGKLIERPAEAAA